MIDKNKTIIQQNIVFDELAQRLKNNNNPIIVERFCVGGGIFNVCVSQLIDGSTLKLYYVGGESDIVLGDDIVEKIDNDTYHISGKFKIKFKPVEVNMVDKPSHYNQGKVECIDAIESAVINKSGVESVCVANVFKYLWRYESKNGLEDVKKAQWYINRLVELMELKNNV